MAGAKTEKNGSGLDEPTRFWEKISLVAEISARCRAARPSSRAYLEVLQLIQQIVPFDAATLYLMEANETRLTEKVSLGERVEILSILRSPRGDAMPGWTARNRKPILLGDRSRKSDFDPEVDFATILSLPLEVDGVVLGLLNVGCYRPYGLNKNHVKLMSVVSDQFAVAIERMFHEQEIKDRNAALAEAHAQLQKAHHEIIAAEKLEAVAELSASINHEINNPLAIILGNAQCMLMLMPDMDEETRMRLRRIEAAAIRVSEVNHKLLNIDTLVSEQISSDGSTRMINIDKSASNNAARKLENDRRQ